MGDLAAAVQQAFEPGPGTRRIGAEVELFALGPASLGDVDHLPAGAGLSREPGGQLEVSLSPRSTAAALAADVVAAVAAVGRHTHVHLEGTHPTLGLEDVPLVLDSPRYRAMQRLFDHTGPDGRRMMRLTASLQVCVDRLPGYAGHEQWLVANLAGPALAAAYANSPTLDGVANGLPGNRTAIWRAMDPARTGYDGSHLDPDPTSDPVDAYRGFARRAPRLRILDAREDTYHLGTLFPPVRPRRGYLELRFLDAQPLERVPEVLDIVSTLMFDRRARSAALELLLPSIGDLGSRWDLAARGLSPEAAELWGIAAPLAVTA
jgi:glutamate--cysteine ligase